MFGTFVEVVNSAGCVQSSDRTPGILSFSVCKLESFLGFAPLVSLVAVELRWNNDGKEPST